MQNINVGDKPIRDGDTVQVDHIITTITVTIRSMGAAVSLSLIKDLIEAKYEVTDIGVANLRPPSLRHRNSGNTTESPRMVAAKQTRIATSSFRRTMGKIMKVRLLSNHPVVQKLEQIFELMEKLGVTIEIGDNIITVKTNGAEYQMYDNELNSSISDETKFNVIFGMNIWQSMAEEGYRFEWCDPDTSYIEDVTAYVKALMQWRDNQTGQNHFHGFEEIVAHKNTRDGNDCTIYTYLIKIKEVDRIVKIQYCSSGGWGNDDLSITTHRSDEFKV